MSKILTITKKDEVFLKNVLKNTISLNVNTSEKALEEFENGNIYITIIDTPFLELEKMINYITKNNFSYIIILSDTRNYYKLLKIANATNSILIRKPLNEIFFQKIIGIISDFYNENNNIDPKKLILQIESMLLVDRAKHLLMDYLNMSEFEAHKYIEKRSMNMRLTKKNIAEDIIKIYENMEL